MRMQGGGDRRSFATAVRRASGAPADPSVIDGVRLAADVVAMTRDAGSAQMHEARPATPVSQ